MKLELMPLLGMKEGAIWAYLNVPEDKPKQSEEAPAGNSIKDDEIPF